MDAGGDHGVASTLAPWECAIEALAVSTLLALLGLICTRNSENPSCPLPVPKNVLPCALVSVEAYTDANPKPSMVWELEVKLIVQVPAWTFVDKIPTAIQA